MVKFAFRKPYSPILIETDSKVYGFTTEEEFEKVKEKTKFEKKDSYIVIDGAGEGWAFHPSLNIVSPLTTHKYWTKHKIIEFVNKGLKSVGSKYHILIKGLSNKRVSDVIQILFEMVIEIENEEN